MSDTLIARLEAAPTGSRELSDEVLVALGWKHWPPTGKWIAPDGPQHCRDMDPTRSVDDALALLAADEGWTISNLDDGYDMTADSAYGQAKTLPNAICIAILRAREASDAR